MQNFVGKTKCIVGYMKVADYSEGSMYISPLGAIMIYGRAETLS